MISREKAILAAQKAIQKIPAECFLDPMAVDFFDGEEMMKDLPVKPSHPIKSVWCIAFKLVKYDDPFDRILVSVDNADGKATVLPNL